MKLITLNIWGGHVYEPLLAFIKAQQDVDIFCFQEVYKAAPNKIGDDERTVRLDVFSELEALLPNHRAFFRPVVNNVYGLALFIKKDIQILNEGEIEIYDNPGYLKGPNHRRNMQWLECCFKNKNYAIMNVHGLWNGKGKTDTPERIAQSKKIKTFVENVHIPKILCGDFNLRPDTESLQLLAQNMHNLIQEHNITSTRTSLYPKAEKFADYIFTSDIQINHFAVLPDEVSDHSPLLLDFM